MLADKVSGTKFGGANWSANGFQS